MSSLPWVDEGWVGDWTVQVGGGVVDGGEVQRVAGGFDWWWWGDEVVDEMGEREEVVVDWELEWE